MQRRQQDGVQQHHDHADCCLVNMGELELPQLLPEIAMNFNAAFDDLARYVPAMQPTFQLGFNAPRPVPGVKHPDQLNWLNQNALFEYDWALYSAANANQPLSRTRPGTKLIGDSGGYQIAKGVWKADWSNEHCPDVAKYRQQVWDFFDADCDYGVGLDVPVFTLDQPKIRQAIGIQDENEALDASLRNFQWFIDNPPNCEMLMVLQGHDWPSCLNWYQAIKPYFRPPFTGFAFGSGTKISSYNTLMMLQQLHDDGHIRKKGPQLFHFLGRSNLAFTVFLTQVKRHLRTWNPEIEVTYDTSNAFRNAGFGGVYTGCNINPDEGWSMTTRNVSDLSFKGLSTRVSKVWPDTAVAYLLKRLTIGQLVPNNGKLDGYGYSIIMHHNTWMLLSAILEANNEYDNGARWNNHNELRHRLDQLLDLTFYDPDDDFDWYMTMNEAQLDWLCG